MQRLAMEAQGGHLRLTSQPPPLGFRGWKIETVSRDRLTPEETARSL
jgi:hypothetical protein